MRAGDFVPETVRIAAMSASGFHVARVPPLVGRVFTPDDEQEAATPVVVIGYDVWQSRFAQDRSVIRLRVNPSEVPRGAGPELFVFGRLAPGATRESAQVELSVLGQSAAAAFPQTNATLKPQVLSYTAPILDIQDASLGSWASRSDSTWLTSATGPQRWT
jgi:hypothetical protein